MVIISSLIFGSLILLGTCTAVTTPYPTATPLPASTSAPGPTLTSPASATSTAKPPKTSTPTTLPAAANKRGIHLLLDDARHTWPGEIWPLHMQYARQVAGEWGYVTQLVRLDDLAVARWQRFMDLCAELHLQPILRLATTQDLKAANWTTPPADPDSSYQTVAARYAGFVSALTWPTADHYIVVGNEPNHGTEWGGRPDPAAYARFLIDVADALHAADPGARVLNAGFDPYTPHTGGRPFIDGQIYMDEETFLDQMVAAYPGVFTHIDLWASHSYPAGPLTAPPWEQTFQIDLLYGATNPHHSEPPPGIFNRGINGYEWELFKLSTYGLAPLPVMITETGWRHAETTHQATTDNGRPWPRLETVGRYLDLAWQGNMGRYPHLPDGGWTPWLDDPRLLAVTPFALNGLPSLWGHTNWLALDAGGKVLFPYPLVDTQAGIISTED